MKFIKVKVVEGISQTIERMINVDHVIQFEPDKARDGYSHVYMTQGNSFRVESTFEELINLFKN